MHPAPTRSTKSAHAVTLCVRPAQQPPPHQTTGLLPKAVCFKCYTATLLSRAHFFIVRIMYSTCGLLVFRRSCRTSRRVSLWAHDVWRNIVYSKNVCALWLINTIYTVPERNQNKKGRIEEGKKGRREKKGEQGGSGKWNEKGIHEKEADIRD